MTNKNLSEFPEIRTGIDSYHMDLQRLLDPIVPLSLNQRSQQQIQTEDAKEEQEDPRPWLKDHRMGIVKNKLANVFNQLGKSLSSQLDAYHADGQ